VKNKNLIAGEVFLVFVFDSFRKFVWDWNVFL